MSFEALQPKDSESAEPRDIDPNVRQRRAADPEASVWVSASAGSGKTKVLTDRVLRLLLPRADGNPGTDPHKILCLTYTKAAAGEMVLRLNKVLSEWAILAEDDLREKLENLLGAEPSQKTRSAARRLFAQVTESPGGLKIMTLHGFCQSLLGRFPLEAGISPHFTALDESESKEILMQAFREEVQQNQKIYYRLSEDFRDHSLMALLREADGERRQLEEFFDNFTEQDRREVLADILSPKIDVSRWQSREELIADSLSLLDLNALKRYADALSHGAKTDQGHSSALHEWLSLTGPQEQAGKIHLLKSVFLTTKDEPRKPPTKGALAFWPDAERVQQEIATALLSLTDQLRAFDLLAKNLDLFAFLHGVLKRYQAFKDRRAALDYNDLILKTLDLLQQAQRTAGWVMYKLDGGLDHILLDEAQDTNPEQWRVLAALIEEFFTPGSARADDPRSVFTVGDPKQSIYRFQRAAPEEFAYMRSYVSELIKLSGQSLRDETLNISFRSARSVLQFVDAAFETAEMKQSVGHAMHDTLQHVAFRRRAAGRVELWPKIMPPEATERHAWTPPTEIKQQQGAGAQLAQQIAQQISQWLRDKTPLESKGRPIQPGDIMILVRSRGAIVPNLLRALRHYRIPVSGSDRLIVTDHIGIQDLLCAAEFALQPRDDLALATLLRSPFINLSEEDLFDLAHDRVEGRGTLWPALEASVHTEIAAWCRRLIERSAGTPHDFFTDLLYGPCPTDSQSALRALRRRLGDDLLDPLEEFLGIVQGYEQNYIPNLQQFMRWVTRNPVEIKRELEESSGAVRIMTVHGAKGLQAPIVFLPDTLRAPSDVTKKVPRLIWPNRSGLEAPIWSPRKEADSNAYRALFDRLAQQETDEYRRLFYVAATRAEDRLVICAAAGRQSAHDESWYHYAESAFQRLGAARTKEPWLPDTAQDIQVLENPQLDDPENRQQTKKEGDACDVSSLPEWVMKPAPPEPAPPKPLQPSRPSETDPTAASPLAGQTDFRFRRGLLTHALLQFLPDVPPADRAQKTQQYLAAQAADLPESVREEIKSEVEEILSHPVFAPLFAPGSIAEVAVSGLLPDGRLIAARIDRLVVRKEAQEVLILDFKTNAPPPEEGAAIPEIYRSQMNAYRAALTEIYPDYRIRCALLWTRTATLMELED